MRGISSTPPGPLASALALVLGAVLLGAAFLVGAVLLAVILGMAVLAGAAVALRVWWLRRGIAGARQPHHPRDGVTIEGEYRRHETRSFSHKPR